MRRRAPCLGLGLVPAIDPLGWLS